MPATKQLENNESRPMKINLILAAVAVFSGLSLLTIGRKSEVASFRDAPAESRPINGDVQGLVQEMKTQTAHQKQEVAARVLDSAAPPSADRSRCGRSVFQDFAGTLPPGASKQFSRDPIGSLSAANLAALRAEIGDLRPSESKIVAKAAANPPYVTHRLSSHRLREVLAAGAKSAPHQTGGWIPKVEENLFGGTACIFAAVGPYEGRPRYGEVLLRINDSAPLPSAWASSGSGMKFVCSRHGFPFPCRFDQVEGQDRIAFASGIYARPEWNARMPLAIINHLRMRPEKERRSIEEKLLSAADRKEFWDIVDEEKVGYLEAKIPEALPLESVSEIVVPPELLGEALSWPEARRWKDKIKAPNNSPAP